MFNVSKDDKPADGKDVVNKMISKGKKKLVNQSTAKNLCQGKKFAHKFCQKLS